MPEQLIPPDLLKSLEDDPEVHKAIKGLVMDSIDQASYLLHNGGLPVRQQIIRTLLPSAIRMLQSRKNEDELDELREKMKELMADVRGEGDVPS